MIFSFLIATLIVWRVTYMVQNENLPFNIGNKFRDKLGTQPWHTDNEPGSFKDLLGCFKCLSFWVAVPCAIYLVDGVLPILGMIVALNAAAIIVNQLAKRYLEL
ncbi:MAG: hypothetical protein WC426_13440 [Sulfuriferula sp.]